MRDAPPEKSTPRAASPPRTRCDPSAAGVGTASPDSNASDSSTSPRCLPRSITGTRRRSQRRAGASRTQRRLNVAAPTKSSLVTPKSLSQISTSSSAASSSTGTSSNTASQTGFFPPPRCVRVFKRLPDSELPTYVMA
eukprot:365208-Chlamydomonas_euryale.AAC.15